MKSSIDSKNIDRHTVHGFGDEWELYDQSSLESAELQELFDAYFHIFPWHALPATATGFDFGCGSGRWAAIVSARVRKLHCIDASEKALRTARKNLKDISNVNFELATSDSMQIAESSQDFGYSLGVIHHIPNPCQALRDCVGKLKKGAPFLVYLYYNFDNRPFWFYALWRMTDIARHAISRLPFGLRSAFCNAIAALIYLPLSRLSILIESCGMPCDNVPLNYYRKASFYTMKTDALDRFGTRVEFRFSRVQVKAMMEDAGLENITFSDRAPFWVACGWRR